MTTFSSSSSSPSFSSTNLSSKFDQHHHHPYCSHSFTSTNSSSSSSPSSPLITTKSSDSDESSVVSASSSSTSLNTYEQSSTPMSIISPAPSPRPDETVDALKRTRGIQAANIINSLVGPTHTSNSQLTLESLNALNSSGPVSRASSQDDAESNKIKVDDVLPEVYCESRARIPITSGGYIFLHVYKNNVDNKEHIAFVFNEKIHSKSLFAPRPNETEQDRMIRGAYDGFLYPGRDKSTLDDEQQKQEKNNNTTNQDPNEDVLVRIHSECYTGETAWSARCDCGEQLEEAAKIMGEIGNGVIVYLRQEGRGIGLAEKLKAYNLQDLGADTVTANLMLKHPADARSFGLATAILLDLGLHNIKLMTNNPDKIRAVEGKNKEIHVSQRVPMVPLSWQDKGGFTSKEVDQYLKTKIERMGHMIEIVHPN